MAVTRKQKEDILATLVENFKKSKSVVFAANHGLSVNEMSELRTTLRDAGIDFQIAKKTLFMRASAESGIELSRELLDGPVGAAFSYEDEVAAAKALAKFAKKHEKLSLVIGVMEGKVLNTAQVIELSALPSKEELLAKFMGSLQAPLSGFVGLGNNLIGGFVRALDQIREQKSVES